MSEHDALCLAGVIHYSSEQVSPGPVTYITGIESCQCFLIRRVREDERGKSGDCMCPHPNVECQHPTCPRGVPEVRAAALRDAKAAVAECRCGYDFCGDCNCRRDAIAAIEALGGER